MRALATSLLALAACHSDGSLEVWVEPRPGMPLEEVELYIGIHDPTVETIKPPAGGRAESVWWARDKNPDLDILIWDEEAAKRGAVRYQILPDDLDKVRALVAVGYATDGNGTKAIVGVATYLHDAEIGSGEVVRRYLELGDFDPLPRRDLEEPRPGVPGIQLWGPPEDPKACVQIDNVPDALGAHGSDLTSAMIVLHGDRDCDSFDRTEAPDKNECMPNEFNSVAPRSRDSLSCVLPERITTPMSVVESCVAGGAMCKDGPGDIACAPSTWCVPTTMCNGTTGSCDDLACNVNSVPHIECGLKYQATASGDRWCQGTSASITLVNQIPGAACDPLRRTQLRKPAMPFWAETLVYGSIDEMWITITPERQDLCEFSFGASGPLQINPGIPNDVQKTYVAAIAFPLTSPVDGRGLGLPILFNAVPSAACAEPEGSCYVVAFSDPALRVCIAAPIVDFDQLVD